jgi:hypothetical protein
LVRVGEALVAAGVAALTSISLCAWVMQGTPADAVARADYSSDSPETTGAIASFDARFIDPSAPSSELLRPALSFEDRFGGATPSRGLAVRTEAVPVADPARSTSPVAERAPRLAAAVPLPRPAPNRAPPRYRLASLGDTPLPSSAYAPPDATPRESGIGLLLRKLTSRDPAGSDTAPSDPAAKDANPLGPDPAHTAIYDISARVVYMPGGERLEAHSGLGGNMDDVRSVHLRSRGPTPPNLYELKLREAPFHGVQAIRLVPVDDAKMYGREGILVHPFMLGPEGASNGCVSVKDYPAFLKAYQRGDITRLVVVDQLDDPPGGRTPAEWFAGTLKKLFVRS